jgi:hypothetical protein
MMRRLFLLLVVSVLVLPATAMASSPVKGAEKRAVVGSVAEADNFDPYPSSRVVGDCWNVRSYDRWAAATYSAQSVHHYRECNQTADYQGKREPWQPDVSILHLTKTGWIVKYEFDESTAKDAQRHGVPQPIFNRLVNGQLFH